MQRVLDTILKKSTPTSSEHRKDKKIIEHVVSTLTKNLSAQNQSAQVMVGGSFAKQTYLKNDKDVDLFIRFPLGTNNISELAKRACAPFKPKTIHGSRDYFLFTHKALHFEVIPVFNITHPDHAQNIMDASPLHVAYVTKHLKNVDDVRLFKALCKAHHVYGAESYISGISGYVLELLVIYYGSFTSALRHIANWGEDAFVDPAKHYSGKEPAKRALSKSKHSPLILIDPTQKTRNAASALSKRNFNYLKKISRAFLDNPSKKLFEDALTLPLLRAQAKKENHFFVSKNLRITGKKDIYLAKLHRALRKLNKKLELLDFTILALGFIPDTNYVRVYAVFPSRFIPLIKRVIGPPKHMKKHANLFVKRWAGKSIRGPYSYGGHVCVDVERTLSDAKEAFFVFLLDALERFS
ncbi:hypothetical protein COT72_00590 [archaeon CG10_big_fil_rev_8_21_14_0_10_43_11]|nr:MAG: hypothetical protein COT72_00590 [archaeon CG10_big_fil_rev_8_21_14_0_10_43_11]